MSSCRFRALGLIGLITLLMIGCGSPRRAEPIVGPLALTEPSLMNGRMVFVEHCHRCHVNGEGGIGPALNDKPLPRLFIRYQVRRGLGAMPAFPESMISESDLNDLTGYVVALRQHGR